jgi:AH receptor-interacting protein
LYYICKRSKCSKWIESSHFLFTDNVKALFRRGKAHIGAWNPEEAKLDFKRVVELDPTLTNTVKKELKILDDMQKEKDIRDKEKLKGMFAEGSS